MCPTKDKESPTKASKNDDGQVRRSISVRLIRHAESQNNAVVTDAVKLFKAGTLESKYGSIPRAFL